MQGHAVHVVGVGEYWGRELPGLVREAEKGETEDDKAVRRGEDKDKMKIAWRYERLGEFGGGGPGARGGTSCFRRLRQCFPHGVCAA